MEFIWSVILMAICFAPIVGMYKIFEKMGVPGWKSLVPIMNIYAWSEVMGLKWWFMFIPLLNVYLLFMLSLNTAKSFGKSGGYAIGFLLLPFVFMPMLGFSDAKFTPVAKDNA